MNYQTKVLIAGVAMLHDGQDLRPGDRFSASEVDADYLVRCRRANLAPERKRAQLEAPVPHSYPPAAALADEPAPPGAETAAEPVAQTAEQAATVDSSEAETQPAPRARRRMAVQPVGTDSLG